jgi:hypothetical protein
MQKEVIIGIVITIVLLLLVIIWAIFVRKEKFKTRTLAEWQAWDELGYFPSPIPTPTPTPTPSWGS